MAFKNEDVLEHKLKNLPFTNAPWISIGWGDYITLDGDLTLAELKLIVETVEQHQKENP